MVVDRSDGRAEQRADLPSYVVEEKMLRDSGILSPLSSQPLRSLSGRKSRRCVLTFGGTIMNIQELYLVLQSKINSEAGQQKTSPNLFATLEDTMHALMR